MCLKNLACDENSRCWVQGKCTLSDEIGLYCSEKTHLTGSKRCVFSLVSIIQTHFIGEPT